MGGTPMPKFKYVAVAGDGTESARLQVLIRPGQGGLQVAIVVETGAHPEPGSTDAVS